MTRSERHPIFDRVGEFYLPSHRVWNGGNELVQLFARLFVLRCEHHAYSDGFEYIAAGPDFEKLQRGDAPLHYTPQFRRLDDGSEIFQGFSR